MADTPNPGSAAAIEQGCTCAVLDNCRGKFPPRPGGAWIITLGCPLHDPKGDDDDGAAD